MASVLNDSVLNDSQNAKMQNDPFWSKLIETRSGVRSPAKRPALDGLTHYLAERKQMIDYPRSDQMGFEVGSGLLTIILMQPAFWLI
jgi:hypothetical protein